MSEQLCLKAVLRKKRPKPSKCLPLPTKLGDHGSLAHLAFIFEIWANLSKF